MDKKFEQARANYAENVYEDCFHDWFREESPYTIRDLMPLLQPEVRQKIMEHWEKYVDYCISKEYDDEQDFIECWLEDDND